jgi:hypothetical protein
MNKQRGFSAVSLTIKLIAYCCGWVHRVLRVEQSRQ